MSMIRVFQNLRRLVTELSEPPATDRDLLDRFVRRDDDEAFAEVVRRHSGAVLGVCRRVLGHEQDAEDAFQATFFVLARRAGSRAWQASVGGWLVQVALHLALRMKTERARRPQVVGELADAESAEASANPELRWVLDEEISRLPEKYRAAVVLCHCEGKSRQEAAQQLGWKPGAVKIRLERARHLLRERLSRRGVALGAALVSIAAPTPVSAALVRTTAAAARSFARGLVSPLASNKATILAEGALRTMFVTRIKLATVFTLVAVALVSSLGWLGYHVFAASGEPQTRTPPRAEATPPVEAAGLAPAPERKVERPLRVLLVAGGPTRDYQFLRSLLVREVDAKRAELSIYLQTAGGAALQDVPAERMLDQFPNVFEPDPAKQPENRFLNLANYDLIISFDANWTLLAEEQVKLLEKWVDRQGGGLIFVAGPIHTYELTLRTHVQRLKPLNALLPVVLTDIRAEIRGPRNKATRLRFPGGVPAFLNLDAEKKEAAAGWEAFFKDGGFYASYPIKRLKATATVIASYEDIEVGYEDEEGKKQHQPFLVEHAFGKGRVLYVSAAETWRLRQFREEYHQRFWISLAAHAASRDRVAVGAAGPRSELQPAERKVLGDGLAWLVKQQHRDGHWEENEGDSRIALTGLSGLALLMEGSTLSEGKYAEPLRRGVDYLIDRSQRNGCIGNLNTPDERGRAMIGHAFAMLFLTSVHGESEDADRQKKLTDVLTRGVEFMEKMQSKEGGWGRDVDRDQPDDLFATLLQIQALRSARRAGLSVNQAKFIRAQKALLDLMGDRSRHGPAALTANYPVEMFNLPTPRGWLATAMKAGALPEGEPALARDWNILSYAHAAYLLGDDGYGRLFPDTRPATRLTWGGYRKSVFPQILREQNADGGFGAKRSRLSTTAVYLAILQMEEGTLPLFQR